MARCQGDPEARRKVKLALEGRLGENGGEIVDDDLLPESMRGREAPKWWNSEHDPFANQQKVSSSASAKTTASGVSVL